MISNPSRVSDIIVLSEMSSAIFLSCLICSLIFIFVFGMKIKKILSLKYCHRTRKKGGLEILGWIGIHLLLMDSLPVLGPPEHGNAEISPDLQQIRFFKRELYLINSSAARIQYSAAFVNISFLF